MEKSIEKLIDIFNQQDEKEKKGIEKDFPNLYEYYYNRFELKSKLAEIKERDKKSNHHEMKELKEILEKEEKENRINENDAIGALFTLIQPILLLFGLFSIFLLNRTIGFISIILAFICQLCIHLDSENSENLLNDEMKKKIEKVINGKPVLQITVSWPSSKFSPSNPEIIQFPIYDYCDVSDKYTIKKNSIISFKKSLLVIDEDSMDYYKPFCATSYKFKLLDLERTKIDYDILFDDEESYNNDPDFQRSYCYNPTNLFVKNLIFRIIIYIFCLKGFYFFYDTGTLNYVKIEIKKVISFSHKLENEFDLSKYNPEITFKDINDQTITGVRANLEISEEEIKNEFTKNFGKIREIYIEECKKAKKKYHNSHDLLDNEIKGMLIPMNYRDGYNPAHHKPETGYELNFINDLIIEIYGRKTKEIFGKHSKIHYLTRKHDNMDLEIITNDDDNDDDDDNEDEDDKNTKTIDNSSGDKKEKSIKEVIYTEYVLKLNCKISSNSITSRYSIKSKNGTSKTGSFNLKKKMSGYEEVAYEKTNNEWTKSEIYLPGCDTPIIITRKKIAIRIQAGNFEIICETKTNADLHSGTTTWLNENDWDKRTVDKYVKNCNKFPQKNRLKIKY